MWKRGEIAPEEQFLLLSTIFYLLLSFYVRTGTRISLTEVEIARVDCILIDCYRLWYVVLVVYTFRVIQQFTLKLLVLFNRYSNMVHYMAALFYSVIDNRFRLRESIITADVFGNDLLFLMFVFRSLAIDVERVSFSLYM